MEKITGGVLFLMTALFMQSCGERFYKLATVSPGKTYRVRLIEKKTEISAENHWPYKVFLTLEKEGHTGVSDATIYTGDEMQARFGNIASETEWVAEKVLRLAREKINAGRPFDWIEFRNDSGETLSYVLINRTVHSPNLNEIFLLIDVKPDEKIRLKVTSGVEELADRSWISCLGRFEGGIALEREGRDFRIVEKRNSQAEYFVTVKKWGTLIENNAPLPKAKPKMPERWYEVQADGLFTFYLPKSLKLTSPGGSPESEWGSTFANDQMYLHADYGSWGGETAPEYLAKQAEYHKEITNIDGMTAKIQSYRIGEGNWGHDYKYATELHIYTSNDSEKKLSMGFMCKQRSDIEIAKKIFNSIQFQ